MGFGGQYNVNYSGSASGCTDPEDDGATSGSFTMTINSTLRSIVDDVRTYDFNGEANGAALDLTITETEGNPELGISGSGTFFGTENEVIEIDGEPLSCTYTTIAGADFGGDGTNNEGAIELTLQPRNITNGFTGSPPQCGSGSCSFITGQVTLTRSPP